MSVIIVSGSRDWTDWEYVWGSLEEASAEFPDASFKFGDCPTGVDKMALDWCEAYGWPYEQFVADWDTYGHSAGPIRNLRMVRSGGDVLLAFPKGVSKGTRGTMVMAEGLGIEVRNEWARYLGLLNDRSNTVDSVATAA